MIWSATPFNNELDVLEIRLAELDPIVDRHVLIEATVTQTGLPKPLYFAENKDRFRPWLDKIEHVVVKDMPGDQNHWVREHFQRDCAMRGLKDGKADDIVFLSDVDEIPRAAALANAVERGEFPVRLEMDLHPYRLNWRWPDSPVRGGTRALLVKGEHLARELPSALVEHTRNWPRSAESTGWHFTYQGDAHRILAKTLEIADEWVRAENVTLAVAQLAIDTGRDIYGRAEHQAVRVDLRDLPVYVHENPNRFAAMLARPDTVAA